MKISGHLGGFVTLAARKESQRDLHVACLPDSATSRGQENRVYMAIPAFRSALMNEFIY